MYSQVLKWTLSPSPNQILFSQAKTKSMASDENGSHFNNTMSNFAFRTGPIIVPPLIVPPPYRIVRFNNHQCGGGGDGGANTEGRKRNKKRSALKDLRVTVPEKIGGGLRAILQGVIGEEVSVIARPSGSERTALFDASAGLISLLFPIITFML